MKLDRLSEEGDWGPMRPPGKAVERRHGLGLDFPGLSWPGRRLRTPSDRAVADFIAFERTPEDVVTGRTPGCVHDDQVGRCPDLDDTSGQFPDPCVVPGRRSPDQCPNR